MGATRRGIGIVVAVFLLACTSVKALPEFGSIDAAEAGGTDVAATPDGTDGAADAVDVAEPDRGTGMDADAGDTGASGTDARDGDAPVCDAGVSCGDVCVDTARDPAHCGACGGRCPAVANGRATCDRGTCGIACDAGSVLRGMACVPIPPPRPIAPLSTATVTSQRPTLRWRLAPGTDGARVELCANRACTPRESAIDVTGDHVVVPATGTTLAPGVHYWRLLGRVGADVGATPSPTWEFFVGWRSAPRDTSWGTVPDFNGDGYADLAVGALAAAGSTGRVYVYHGGAAGVGSVAVVTLGGTIAGGEFGRALASAGDVNGDGYADLVVGAPHGDTVYVHHGGAAGVALAAAVALTRSPPSPPPAGYGWSLAGAGDLDGDGYGDLVVGTYANNRATARAYVYQGGPTGLVPAPLAVLGAEVTANFFGARVAGVGDVDADGFADVAVSSFDYDMGRGRVDVYLGGATFPVRTRTIPSPDGGLFGTGLAGAGDVNGDGCADVLVGAYGVPTGGTSDVGRAYIFSGDAMRGVATTPSRTLSGADAGTRFFGNVVESAGDLNADGYPDLVISGHVFLGGATGFPSRPSLSLTTAEPGLASGRDLNGDGYDDLVIGEAGFSSSTGRVLIFMGGRSGVSTPPTVTLSGLAGPGSYFGGDLAARGVWEQRWSRGSGIWPSPAPGRPPRRT